MHDPGTITAVLQQARGGNREAIDRLFTMLYDELGTMARRQLRGEEQDRTLNTAALINEAYLRIVDQTRVDWPARSYFFAYAARAMRAVLVDYARRRGTAKRGSGAVHLPLDEEILPVDAEAELLVELGDALDRLSRLSERLSQTVECRFFAGLTETETAEALGVSERTVRRDWIKARAWLYTELSAEAAG